MRDIAELIAAVAVTPGRHIPLPGTFNLRDAGGYPVSGGGQVAWRRLLRSDALHHLDGAAAGLLGDFGLRTVVDLRTSAEVLIAPGPVDDLAARGAVTMHVSLLGDDLTGLPPDLRGIYDYVIDARGAAIAGAIRSLARPGGLPALVHCTAGKDRTGIVVAFALAVVGVADRFVAADYAISSLYLDPRSTPVLGQLRAGFGLGEELTEALLVSPPELIIRVLDRARRQAGTIAGYLTSHGVTEAELDRLRGALVSGSAPSAGASAR